MTQTLKLTILPKTLESTVFNLMESDSEFETVFQDNSFPMCGENEDDIGLTETSIYLLKIQGIIVDSNPQDTVVYID